MTFDALRSSDAGIALVGGAGEEFGRILRANQQFATLLARPLDTLVGTAVWEHLHADDREEARASFKNLIADVLVSYEKDVRLLAADGPPLHVRSFASSIATASGPAIVLRVAPL